jgi:hypothetical protein
MCSGVVQQIRAVRAYSGRASSGELAVAEKLAGQKALRGPQAGQLAQKTAEGLPLVVVEATVMLDLFWG